ncbi:MAG TPA: tRNA dihydrouridine synthase DusB [Clostridiales bacterium]|nr:tRNA dihydrouridine synthase DusB [Clostridiales bacterium]HCG35390.1 tRNA dihydrouridine synthase DusB [Clostridiales bacterium]
MKRMKQHTPLFLGPMAGYTDSACRRLCREYGADIVCSEMISAKALCYGDNKTHELAYFDPDERPIGLQIFGNDPVCMAKGAEMVYERYRPDFFDINMGCPVPKIVKSGDGSALMRDPALAGQIVEAVVKAVPVPVTVKIRAGWDESCLNAPEVAKAAEAGGAGRIVVHGKTRVQFYAPPVNPSIIAAVKQAVSIPVIANGDIDSGESAKTLLEQTGCDGLMIGRAAIGAPWIFKQAREVLEGKPQTEITLEERFACMYRHIDMACEQKGQDIAIPAMRGHLSGYMRGLYGAATMRNRLNQENDKEQVRALLKEYYFSLKNKEDDHG